MSLLCLCQMICVCVIDLGVTGKSWSFWTSVGWIVWWKPGHVLTPSHVIESRGWEVHCSKSFSTWPRKIKWQQPNHMTRQITFSQTSTAKSKAVKSRIIKRHRLAGVDGLIESMWCKRAEKGAIYILVGITNALSGEIMNKCDAGDSTLKWWKTGMLGF